MKLVYIFLSFIIYAFIGWLIEVFFTFVSQKKLINRGFLIGPYCPIYGVAGILITFFLERFYEYPIVLFILTAVICAFLEYITSYTMEKLFNARWWDYSKFKFNINGRICLETLVPFGMLGCVLIYVVNPLMKQLFSLLTTDVWFIIAIFLVILFILDLTVSFKIIANFKKKATKFLSSDNTEEISKKVKDYLDEVSSLINTRLVKAFPNVNNSLNELKENLKKMKDELERNSKKNIINRIKSMFNKKRTK